MILYVRCKEYIIMSRSTISGFEYQQLQVGQLIEGEKFEKAHWQALVKLHASLPLPYYSLTHQGIRLSHYVGVIRVSFFDLEILPKPDAHVPTSVWRQILVDMLVESGYWRNPSSVTESSRQAHHLLDQWLLGFLDEVARLCRQGLIRQYQTVRTNARALKGRLLFSQQIRRNSTRQDRFAVSQQTYTLQHALHQLLKQALLLIPRVSDHPVVQRRARQLLTYFASVRVYGNETPQPPSSYHRRTEVYRTAVTAAHQLLNGQLPHVYHGPLNQGFALLIDMNQLFEIFIYERLRRLSEHHPFVVRRQHSRRLWGDTQVRPDLVVEYPTKGIRTVIDTKWKVLSRSRPAASDLHQIYVYNQLFGAQKGILLYPQVHDLLPALQRFDGPGSSYAEVSFVPIADTTSGRLHPSLDDALLRMIAPT